MGAKNENFIGYAYFTEPRTYYSFLEFVKTRRCSATQRPILPNFDLPSKDGKYVFLTHDRTLQYYDNVDIRSLGD